MIEKTKLDRRRSIQKAVQLEEEEKARREQSNEPFALLSDSDKLIKKRIEEVKEDFVKGFFH